MEISKLERVADCEWRIEPQHGMNVPAVLFATEEIVRDLDDKVYEQITNVARLPGIVEASYAMPDAHWGYGFPIGGVAAFDAAAGGVVSAGGVGFDISCGVRTMLTGLVARDVAPVKDRLADGLFETIPAGVGSTGSITLDDSEMDAMLTDGARWAVSRGYGDASDLERIEDGGRIPGALSDAVSSQARKRQRREMGTLGSGNHYLEVQEIAEIYDAVVARGFGLVAGEVVVSIHCGSRGLGHQIGTEYLREMVEAAARFGIVLPDRELACAPIESELGGRYLGAMRAGVNCALANRQIISHLTRGVFADVFPGAALPLLFDVSHNTCKVERHAVEGTERVLHVHRKGATRAFGPDDAALTESLREYGQPVIIGGSMGTGSYVLVGASPPGGRAFASACHGAGRAMSRRKASKRWKGRALVDELAEAGIIIRGPSLRGFAEEAPGAYKDVGAVVRATEFAGLAQPVARLRPMVCVKG